MKNGERLASRLSSYAAVAEYVAEPDIQLMVEIRQSVLSKQLDKQAVTRALEFMLEWNKARAAPET